MFFTECAYPDKKCQEQRKINGKCICAIALRRDKKKKKVSNCLLEPDIDDIKDKFDTIENEFDKVDSIASDIDSSRLNQSLRDLKKAIKNMKELL